MSKFKDESLYFHFHADEELEGTSSKNKQLCSDFKIVENILAKWLLVAGPSKILTTLRPCASRSGELPCPVFTPFGEVSGNPADRQRPWGQTVCIIQFPSGLDPYCLARTIKDPDHPEALCFQIWGAAPPCFYAMGRGSKAEAAGLSAGQCILKVNCSSIASEGALVVLKDFQAFQSCGQEALESGQWLGGEPGPPMTWYPAPKWQKRTSLLTPGMILEALAADDSAFMQNCRWLMAMSIAIMIMSHYDFCNIFNTKLESIDQRITCCHQFAAQLKSWVSPAFKQVALEPHVLCSLNFWPTNCHINLMEVFNPKMTSSMGRSFSIQFGCKPSLIDFDPKQEFKQKEECMVCGWILIQINIQEDPWNIPSSIMTLVVNSQRYVEDAEVQLHRYAIFCQALVATTCTFSEQLLEALSYGYNNNGEYEESSRRQPQVAGVGGGHWGPEALPVPACNGHGDTNVFYHIEGSQQALKVVLYLNGYYFSKLPSRQNRASLQPHTVLFTKALENVEVLPPPGRQAAEDLQKEINAQSLENVQQYYKLRPFYLEPLNLPMDASTTAMKIDQLICSINALDDLCHLVKSFMPSKPGTSRSMGTGLPVSSELCYHMGACQIAMCSTGMQRSILSVSLEQVAVLAQSHGLLPKCMMQATDMQKQGTIDTGRLLVLPQAPLCF
ncbi:Phosphatidylinositol 3,4,5-trisphosphate-dependent Rac exchanger 1 protein [Sciurus carolinensis]|uniref:Phosphatidylinositol 3,4,5-trisphosphate-dependent Rac exchanger 1 protein n=1 Tax=Sciurus carolinensis TaxID=30640 RepID=A0AA41N2H5_SCICA|nr:Phosphatidylinositol 3,4,5-trisphosphate-dependent Rac exchanger 1 protein [Sciurus carolinensis]